MPAVCFAVGHFGVGSNSRGLNEKHTPRHLFSSQATRSCKIKTTRQNTSANLFCRVSIKQ
eukprot:scaffold330080_cov255-Cyclotella_meneghiniana.AAC.1